MTLNGKDDINVWMMPGKVIPYQPNNENFRTTSTINKYGDMHILINRDDNGFAEGSLFFDVGDTLHEIENKIYEHFKMQHSGKTIKKWNINDSPQEGKESSFSLDKIAILNAADLKDVNFACVRDIHSGRIVELALDYHEVDNTLSIAPHSGAIELSALDSIYYGNSDTEVNLCDPSTQFYKF